MMTFDQSWVWAISPKYIYWVTAGMSAILLVGVGMVANMFMKAVKSDRKKLSDIGPILDSIEKNHLTHIEVSTSTMAQRQQTTNEELAKQTGKLDTLIEIFRTK
jgi:predicted dinucleotide-utilizing enzyme